MLTFYSTPLPGSTLSFTGAIVGGGTWLQGLLVGGAASDWMDAYLRLANNLFDRGTEIEAGGGLMSLILSEITSIQTTIMGFINTVIFEVFLCLIALMLIVIYAVTMAQVIWAQLALGILLILGPIFIPFLMIEPMAFLFWGWFKGLWVYSLYAAIAAALMRVFLAASLGYITAIMSPPADVKGLPSERGPFFTRPWFASSTPPRECRLGARGERRERPPLFAGSLGSGSPLFFTTAGPGLSPPVGSLPSHLSLQEGPEFPHFPRPF